MRRWPPISSASRRWPVRWRAGHSRGCRPAQSSVKSCRSESGCSPSNRAYMTMQMYRVPQHATMHCITGGGCVASRPKHMGCDAMPLLCLQVVETYLWQQQRFRLPHYGRSNVPTEAVVDHPGTRLPS